MCIIFAVRSPSSEYKFALAMDRDESFLRETAPLQYWPDLGIFCGKDVAKGGTWLAIDQKGRFAAITNIKQSLPIEAGPSRGMIPLELLKQENFDLIEWIKVVKSLECKNFNVLFGDLNQKCPKVYVFSSVSSELESVSFDDSKIFSLSNGSASSNWDKQQKGKEMIQNYIDSNVFTESSLFSVLTDSTKFSEDISDYTKWPIFLNSLNSRGTVSSSVLLFSNDGKVDFIEKSWSEKKELKTEVRVSFSIQQ